MTVTAGRGQHSSTAATMAANSSADGPGRPTSIIQRRLRLDDRRGARGAEAPPEPPGSAPSRLRRSAQDRFSAPPQAAAIQLARTE